MGKNYQFRLEDFFPEELFQQITELRVHKKEIIVETAKTRRKRDKLTKDGKLTILAADHPARGITASNGDPLIMGNRHQYLGRILRVITSEEFDGVMGTTDILEDLFLVNYLLTEQGKEPFLDDKVLLGCMNRGGIAKTVFEMDDRYTSWTAESIHRMRLDGAKLMFRLDPTSPDSGATIDYTAQAICQLNEYDIPAFVECLPVEKVEGKYSVNKTPEALVQAIGIATALGDSSRNIWLKIPYVGFHYITAITKPQIEKLLKTGLFQMLLFDQDLAEVETCEGIRYLLRRNPLRVEEIAQTRQSKLAAMQRKVNEQNLYLAEHPRAVSKVARRKVKEKIEQLKLSGWLSETADGRKIFLVEDTAALAEETKLDGCYVLKTDLGKQAPDQVRGRQRPRRWFAIGTRIYHWWSGHLAAVRPSIWKYARYMCGPIRIPAGTPCTDIVQGTSLW